MNSSANRVKLLLVLLNQLQTEINFSSSSSFLASSIKEHNCKNAPEKTHKTQVKKCEYHMTKNVENKETRVKHLELDWETKGFLQALGN